MYDNICTNLCNWHQNHDTEQFHQPPKNPPHSISLNAHPPPPLTAPRFCHSLICFQQCDFAFLKCYNIQYITFGNFFFDSSKLLQNSILIEFCFFFFGSLYFQGFEFVFRHHYNKLFLTVLCFRTMGGKVV